MKKIINGTIFDTATAKLVGTYDHKGGDDINYTCEGLYVTRRSNKFFLAGEGGVNTKYYRYAGKNTYSRGKKIIPLTASQADAWRKRYLNMEPISQEQT